MSKYSSIADLFTGICDAIRSKDGTTDLIQHQDIPDRIMALSSSGDSTMKQVKMTVTSFINVNQNDIAETEVSG